MGVEELAAVKEVSNPVGSQPVRRIRRLSKPFPVDGKSACHRGQFSHRRNAYTLMALEIGKGDEVITPSLTWFQPSI